MANISYTHGRAVLMGDADWGSSAQTFSVALVSDEYKPSESHKYAKRLRGYELHDGGYKRAELTGRKVEVHGGKVQCMADSAVFRGLSLARFYRYAVILRSRLLDSDSDLICALDIGKVKLHGFNQHSIHWGGQSGRGPVFSLT